MDCISPVCCSVEAGMADLQNYPLPPGCLCERFHKYFSGDICGEVLGHLLPHEVEDKHHCSQDDSHRHLDDLPVHHLPLGGLFQVRRGLADEGK